MAKGKLLANRLARSLQPLVEMHFRYLPMRHARVSTQTLKMTIWKVEFANRLVGLVGLWGKGHKGKGEDLLREATLDILDGKSAGAGVLGVHDIEEVRVGELVPYPEVLRLAPGVNVVV